MSLNDVTFLKDVFRYPKDMWGNRRCYVKTYKEPVRRNGVVFADDPRTVYVLNFVNGVIGKSPVEKFDTVEALTEKWCVD